MTLQDEKKWRDLCRQAMCEKDVNKLLKIFLELDRATEREQRRERFAIASNRAVRRRPK